MQLTDVKAWVFEQQLPLLAFLETLVNINTFTENITGVDQGMDILSQQAQQMGFLVEVLNGRHRLIKTENSGDKCILLVTHMDTVHPADGAFQVFERLPDDYVRGPGIGDMKGGLVMGLWAMQAMKRLCPDANIQMVVSVDEEIGSPTIRDWYMTGGADCAIGLEPGFPQGKLTSDVPMGVVRQRKGCGRIHFTVRGKAAHAGGAWQDGLSAVEAMAHRILKIHALTDLERGITTNVGLVNGGTAANTIAEYCTAAVDFRFLTNIDGEETLNRLHEIINMPAVDRGHVCDTAENVETILYMPPMEHTSQNQQLVDIILKEAVRLGQNVVPITRGGGSDANWISRSGTPSICGMGAPAEGIHTTEERILIPLMFDRLELLIATLYRLAND